ncbi:MAG: hypothetical protein ACFFE8_11005, partial [Candidatus Heimdallarchaeota archaeon]
SLHVFHRIQGGLAYTKQPLALDKSGCCSSALPAPPLDITGVEYYFVAKDKLGNEGNTVFVFITEEPSTTTTTPTKPTTTTTITTAEITGHRLGLIDILVISTLLLFSKYFSRRRKKS